MKELIENYVKEFYYELSPVIDFIKPTTTKLEKEIKRNNREIYQHLIKHRNSFEEEYNLILEKKSKLPLRLRNHFLKNIKLTPKK